MIWRLWVHGERLKDLNEYYDIIDIYDANEALDLKEEVERLAQKRAEETK